MRDLTKAGAAACENATEDRCRCRCGGRFHGAKRLPDDRLYELPHDDPHKPGPEQLELLAKALREISGNA